ncbi:aly/REF export factor 2 isoform X2 [Sitodiplosis mosellana]|uniref:aly/REF export factor 2 isoform X2 n=1 Tax=Sitodiplosis mosellana TaxID=263140 RepID=UPI002443A38F|nr:aly/REF export factor 2 isoform X2 [Sitodiplosis mosellana]
MVDKIEMSLDDIIKTNKIGFRRGGTTKKQVNGAGGGNRRKAGGKPPQKFRGTANRQIGKPKGRSFGGAPTRKFTRGDVNGAWKHDMFEGGKKQLLRGAVNGLINSGSAKLLVSNLDYGVSETDIHELFADFGPLKSASVHYDRSGRSLGTADVVFERRADAVKAMKQYNGVPLDGRPMNIQLATSEVPQPAVRTPRPTFGQNRNNQSRPQRKPGPRQGGGGGVGGKRGGNRANAKPVSAEELDAELDAYVNDMKL